MRAAHRLLAWLRAHVRRGRMERDMDVELRFHVDAYADDLVRDGTPRDEALRRARVEFGGIERAKEACRDARGTNVTESFLQDLRYGARMLRRNPGFAAVAVLSLALGIGANTAIFTLIDAVMLRSLPVKNPRELVLVHWTMPLDSRYTWYDGDSWPENGAETGSSFAFPAYEAMRGAHDVFAGLFAFKDLGNHVNVVADGEAGLAHGYLTTAGMFATLGLHPAAGRFFDESDDAAGAEPVCVISDAYWERRFGGDRAIAGKAITIAGVPFRIAGVTPRGFSGVEPGNSVDIWVPMAEQPIVAPDLDRKASLFTAADHWWVLMIARLQPGVSPVRAAAALQARFAPIGEQGVAASRQGGRRATPSLDLRAGANGLRQLERQFSRPLFVLMGIVGLVLLIACANVANLLLARATARQREIGMRLSLGASRGRLVRQLMTESLLLSGIGTAAGCLLSIWGGNLLVELISPASNPLSLDVAPDLRVLGFAAAACLVTGLLFGLAPAWRSTRTDLATTFKQQPGSGAAGLRLGLGGALVVSQVAMSLVLLFGAALFVRSLVNLQRVNTGFTRENVLIFGLNPTKSGYKEAALGDFYARVQQRIADVPGVVSATASWHLLIGNGTRGDAVSVPGFVSTSREDRSVRILPVGPRFFETMKIPLLRGRDFDERDHEHAPHVAVVNEAFARRYFAGADPVGRQIIVGSREPKITVDIVGLARDAKYASLRETVSPTVYHPIRQATDTPYMYFEARTASDPLALVPAVRAAVASVDRNVPLFGIKTQSEQIDESLLEERLFAKLTSFFGGLALIMASIGLYGVLSYAVGRRTREIGIRMAIGARRGNILSMIARETLQLVAIGVLVGIPAALATTRIASSAISGVLYDVKPMAAAPAVIATALLLGAGAIAGFVPARRASRVDPMQAVRCE